VNLRGAILSALVLAKRARDSKEMAARLAQAATGLRVYILLVAFAACVLWLWLWLVAGHCGWLLGTVAGCLALWLFDDWHCGCLMIGTVAV
jgi:hypothetical protein